MNRLMASVLVGVLFVGLGASNAVASAPGPTHNIDACALNGSTTVSWNNFHAKEIDFFWLDGTTPVSSFQLITHGTKSPASVTTPSGVNNVFVQWFYGNSQHYNASAACS